MGASKPSTSPGNSTTVAEAMIGTVSSSSDGEDQQPFQQETTTIAMYFKEERTEHEGDPLAW